MYFHLISNGHSWHKPETFSTVYYEQIFSRKTSIEGLRYDESFFYGMVWYRMVWYDTIIL